MRYHEPKNPTYEPKHAETTISQLDVTIFMLEQRLNEAQGDLYDTDELLMLGALDHLKELRTTLQAAAREELDEYIIKQAQKQPPGTISTPETVEAVLRKYERKQARRKAALPNSTSESQPLREAPTKRLVWAQEVTAKDRLKNFDFTPGTVLHIQTGHVPSTRDMESGLWRRINTLKRGNPRDNPKL